MDIEEFPNLQICENLRNLWIKFKSKDEINAYIFMFKIPS